MKNTEFFSPGEIEKRSMEIIESELGPTPRLSAAERTVLKRVIHTTADFDYKENLVFSQNATAHGLNALKAGATIVTDTNMALSGISKPALAAVGCEAVCFMADPEAAERAKALGTTRAAAAVDMAAERFGGKNLIFAVGNAPTALLRLCELTWSEALSPRLIIGAPVGFVNVIQSKTLLTKSSAPHIAAMGRKGGSTVAAAICNALLYMLFDREQSHA